MPWNAGCCSHDCSNANLDCFPKGFQTSLSDIRKSAPDSYKLLVISSRECRVCLTETLTLVEAVVANFLRHNQVYIGANQINLSRVVFPDRGSVSTQFQELLIAATKRRLPRGKIYFPIILLMWTTGILQLGEGCAIHPYRCLDQMLIMWKKVRYSDM